MLASGEVSIDALSAGAATGITKSPILLLDKKTINTGAIKLIKDNSKDGVYILGGASTINLMK